MKKIKVSAETILSILKNVMEAADYEITDKSAPASWQNKKVSEVLNVDYYTFKHRPFDTITLIKGLIAEGKNPNSLMGLNRAFGLLSLGATDRVWSNSRDLLSQPATLEFYLQTSKVKLLEDFFEDLAVDLTGVKVPVQIGKEVRQVLIAFGNLSVASIDEITEFGEMSVAEINIDFVFSEKSIGITDYKVEFLVSDEVTSESKWVEVPISGISFDSSMQAKSVPGANNVRDVGSVNLSRVRTFVLTFDGYDNEFINSLTDDTLSSDYTYEEEQSVENAQDNNKSYILRLTRGDKTYYYETCVKSHTVRVEEGTGSESHSLVLTKRGLTYGTT